MMYILLLLLFVSGDHCSCFPDDRFQPNTAIFKSDGSDVYAYILCTWWSGVAIRLENGRVWAETGRLRNRSSGLQFKNNRNNKIYNHT